MKKKIVSVVLAVLLLVVCVGCAKEPEKGVLEKEAVKEQEALYGKSMEDVCKELGISEKQIKKAEDGEESLTPKEKVVLGEQKFTQTIDCYPDGFHTRHLKLEMKNGDEEIVTVAKAVYEEAAAMYGAPLTEGYETSIQALKSGDVEGEFYDIWEEGEKTQIWLMVSRGDNDQVLIELSYEISEEATEE